MVGEYISLCQEDFNGLMNYSLDQTSDVYLELRGKHFVSESISDPAIELLSVKYRTKKAFLSDFTSLHMFVITQRCNQGCTYCQVSSQNQSQGEHFDMSTEIAKEAVDIMLMSPSRFLKVEFQGGEPLLNIETLKFVVDYARKQAQVKNKQLELVVCTNLTLATDDILKYLRDNNVCISTSLDGPKHIHDHNRKYRSGEGTYEDTIRSLHRARRYISQDRISALMTTTSNSLGHAREIVDEYVERGFYSLFLRPLNPFGYAKRRLSEIGYSTSDFIRFFKEVLEYILSLNKEGVLIEETYASLLLRRILTPFSDGFVDLQFPTGAGISGVVYGHDGKVYISDEARMLGQLGDFTFCVGDIKRDSYKEIFFSEKIKWIIGATCAELLPYCNECVYQPYCGIDPVRNYATENDIIGFQPANRFCILHKSIFDYLFDIIIENDESKLDIFWSWMRHQPFSETGSG